MVIFKCFVREEIKYNLLNYGCSEEVSTEVIESMICMNTGQIFTYTDIFKMFMHILVSLNKCVIRTGTFVLHSV